MFDHNGAEIVNSAIGFLIGLWVTLVGFGTIPPPGRDEARREAFFARWGKTWRKLGPIVLVLATALLLHAIFRSR